MTITGNRKRLRFSIAARRVGAGMMLSFVALTFAWAQQMWREFEPHAGAYKVLLGDLVAIRKATQDPVEGAVLDGFINVIPLAVERCDAARDLLIMRDLVHSEAD